MENHHKTNPPNYEGTLSEEASQHRADLEARRDAAFEAANAEENPIKRVKTFRVADMLDVALDFQGANPKKLEFDDLKEHIRSPSPYYDELTNQFKAKIKNRATAIRAYCIGCVGGNLVDVRMCASLCCPLHPFRMGKDPIRGYELPKVDEPEIELDDEDTGEFEEGEDDGD